MKRIFIIFPMLILAGCVALWCAGTWLAGTPGGISWLLREVSRQTPVKITAKTVTGGIGRALLMTGVTARWQLGEIEIQELQISCRPLWLTLGRLVVQDLSLSGVRYQDNTPDSGRPPDLTWPHLSGIPIRLQGRVDHLRMKNFSYHLRDAQPVVVTGISAKLNWQDGTLSITELNAATREGRIRGVVTAGFDRPLLSAALSATPVEPVTGFDRFDLRTRLLPGTTPEQISGAIALTGLQSGKVRRELTGTVSITRSSIILRKVNLARPGDRGRMQGEGTITLTAGSPQIRAVLTATDLDLAEDAGLKTRLTGTIAMEGTADRYSGRFSLSNKGASWQTIRLTGRLNGGGAGVTLSQLQGIVLGGQISGELGLGWSDGFTVTGALAGTRLDPVLVSPEWSGLINLDLRGHAQWRGSALVQAALDGQLHQSRFRELPLSGNIAARLSDGTLTMDSLRLSGKDFDIRAAGSLARRLAITAKISDLSGLIPRTHGRLDLKGWLRHTGTGTSGAVTGQGSGLSGAGLRIGTVDLSASGDSRPGFPLRIATELKMVTWKGVHADAASIAVKGTPERHAIQVDLRSSGARLASTAAGSYGGKNWEGEIMTLSGTDRIGPWELTAPVRLSLSPHAVSLSPLKISGIRGEKITLKGRMARDTLQGSLEAAWHDLDLGRIDQWLEKITLSGRSSGRLQLESPDGERPLIGAHLIAAGQVTLPGGSITVRHAALDLDADKDGIRSSMEFRTSEGINVVGRFTAPPLARLGAPDRGDVNAAWEGLDLGLFRGALPPELHLNGTLAGSITGKLLSRNRLDLSGKTFLVDGAAQWHVAGRQLSTRVKRGELAWSWQGSSLNGKASLLLAEHGEASGSFSIPLPARLETFLEPEGKLEARVTGQVYEKGILTALFPGLLQESRGVMGFALRADGIWREPQVSGNVEVSRAGAYLPAAGVTLEGVSLNARLEQNRILVNDIMITSGPGSISGNAELRLSGGRLAGCQGHLRGDKFQVVRLPDLKVLASPDLSFEGSSGKLSVRGVVAIPELLATGGSRTTIVQPSRDVIIHRGDLSVDRKSPMALDIRVKATLGDRVFINVAGIDGKLEGGVDLIVRGLHNMNGSGEIKVAKGRYSAYGVTLDIKRGRAIFTGGPLEQPTLDILALRETGDHKAGVTVSGTPLAPVVKLYAEPAMPDVDILSYIVFGRKLSDTEQKPDLLMQAASLLSSQGQSVYLQEQIKQRLGVDTFAVTSSRQQGSDYKRIESSLLTQPSKPTTGSISDSMLQVGKYLTPGLYVSYGWSLFNDTHLFKVRYNITRQLEIETSAGTSATGADIFYRIEFE